MKIENRKSKIKNCILFLLAFLACGCGEWLDGALPRDQNLADKQYSTEKGTFSALNGLYTRLNSYSLYGGQLTMTDIELMAHYYYYDTRTSLPEFRGYEPFYFMSSYAYASDNVASRFGSIWNEAYKLIFEVNTFLANMEASTVFSEERKKILMGEAFALRAFLHLDLYRLFGGEIIDEEGRYYRQIPYNSRAEVVPHPDIYPAEFVENMLFDIDVAIKYLEGDPIRTQTRILDFSLYDDVENTFSQEYIFENFLRNYRMNYYAARAVKARMLMFIGQEQEAADEAQAILDECFGENRYSGKPFYWTDWANIEAVRNRNYIFYEEILFGIFNQDLYERWRNYTGGTVLGSTYAVHGDHLRENIFKNDVITDGEPRRWEDRRARQWQASLMDDAQYVSLKYERFQYSNNNPKEYFQPLIRTGELHYIIAEAHLKAGRRDAAVDILDNFYVKRGAQAGRVRNNVSNDEHVYSFLETEHYKEFYGEGQVWFFLKRQSAKDIFSATAGGQRETFYYYDFFPPRPQRERDF